MHVNVKIYIRFQILLVWTFTEYYINIFGGAERYSAPPRNNFGGAAPPPLPTPLIKRTQTARCAPHVSCTVV